MSTVKSAFHSIAERIKDGSIFTEKGQEQAYATVLAIKAQVPKIGRLHNMNLSETLTLCFSLHM